MILFVSIVDGEYIRRQPVADGWEDECCGFWYREWVIGIGEEDVVLLLWGNIECEVWFTNKSVEVNVSRRWRRRW